MNLADITKQIRAFADQLEEQNKTNDPPQLTEEQRKQGYEQYGFGPAITITDASPFQLPPPPPGMSWHRLDGWQEGDLPQGYRPIVLDEKPEKGDECFSRVHRYEEWKPVSGLIGADEEELREHIVRTTRPLTFEHAGKTWNWHRPGSPMPCDAWREVFVVFQDGDATSPYQPAEDWDWGQYASYDTIIGWRYAEPATKEVEIGPCDVPPFSLVRHPGWLEHDWRYVEVVTSGVLLISAPENRIVPFDEMKRDGWLINRSIPLTGKWNPDAWEKCSKTVPA